MTQLLAPRPVGPAVAGPPDGWVTRAVERVWRDRGMTALIVITLTGVAALAARYLMPRGPVTAAQVIAAMLGCAAVGVAAGFALRSRWAMLLTPVLFTVMFEIARVGVVGPSVDRPRFDTTIGVLIFFLGRVFSGVLMLLPMVVGGAYGAGLARRLRDGPASATGRAARYARHARQGVAALLAVALVGLGVLLTRPGSTAEITGSDGRSLHGSVAELATVRLGGHDQSVLIRARSTARPVLLYLAGGPGQSDIGYTRAYMPSMENDFVFAVWDQRGTGRSYPALDPTSTWTLERAVADTVELTRYLSHRFHQNKIYLFGNSWGSTLGVLAVRQHPELYAGYIGTGQMVSQLASDRIIYHTMLDYAARTHDTALADRMRAWGEPPYTDIYAYAFLIDYYDKIGPYDKTAYFESHRPGGIDGNGASEYGPIDKVNKLRALVDMGSVMYPQLQGLDFRRDVPALHVPVYLVMGSHELDARTQPARDWFNRLQAPAKHWVTFENSGHIPQFEEFDRFHDMLTNTVLPQTRGAMS